MNLSTTLQIRIAPRDVKMVRLAAHMEGLRVSDFVRRVLYEQAERIVPPSRIRERLDSEQKNAVDES